MRTWGVSLIVLVVLSVIASYFFVPAQLMVSTAVGVKANPTAVRRLLLEDSGWNRWWPGSVQSANRLTYDGLTYKVIQQEFLAVKLSIGTETKETVSEMILIPRGDDSTIIKWEASTPSTLNLFTRFSNLMFSRSLRPGMLDILQALKKHTEDERNLYGIKVANTKVTDTVLAVTDTLLPSWPTNAEVSLLISLLHVNIKALGRKETGSPMLYVDSLDRGYKVMVGVPVNLSFFPDLPQVYLKRMVPGNLLCTDVKGGPYSSALAYNQLERYMQDYNFRSVALPYERLLTDRTETEDTTRWMSQICYPVY